MLGTLVSVLVILGLVAVVVLPVPKAHAKRAGAAASRWPPGLLMDAMTWTEA